MTPSGSGLPGTGLPGPDELRALVREVLRDELRALVREALRDALHATTQRYKNRTIPPGAGGRVA